MSFNQAWPTKQRTKQCIHQNFPARDLELCSCCVDRRSFWTSQKCLSESGGQKYSLVPEGEFTLLYPVRPNNRAIFFQLPGSHRWLIIACSIFGYCGEVVDQYWKLWPPSSFWAELNLLKWFPVKRLLCTFSVLACFFLLFCFLFMNSEFKADQSVKCRVLQILRLEVSGVWGLVQKQIASH